MSVEVRPVGGFTYPIIGVNWPPMWKKTIAATWHPKWDKISPPDGAAVPSSHNTHRWAHFHLSFFCWAHLWVNVTPRKGCSIASLASTVLPSTQLKHEPFMSFSYLLVFHCVEWEERSGSVCEASRRLSRNSNGKWAATVSFFLICGP